MPLRSEAQRAWMHANHPEMAARWEKETPAGPLPERVGKKSAQPKSKPRKSLVAIAQKARRR